jgi:hypothetical protein
MLQFWTTLLCLPLFEIALVLVRLNHVARVIVNANHNIMFQRLVRRLGVT